MIGTQMYCQVYGCVFVYLVLHERMMGVLMKFYECCLFSRLNHKNANQRWNILRLSLFVFLGRLSFYLRNFFQSAFVFVLYAVMKSLAGIWNGKALGNSTQSNLVMT